jgi:hypothetical protein
MSNIGAMEYLETVRQEIVQHKKYLFSCGLIAIDIAAILLKQAGDPVVVGLKGRPMDRAGNSKPLVPKLLEGKVSWSAHLVCVESGLAFDPLVPEPIDFEHYIAETFTEPPERGVTFHRKELLGLIAQRPAMLQNVRESAPFVVLSDVAQLAEANRSLRF